MDSHWLINEVKLHGSECQSAFRYVTTYRLLNCDMSSVLSSVLKFILIIFVN